MGAAQLEEAEELMVTAWTKDNVDFRGEHYRAAFPSVRPRPYQQPHPPLARACINRESIIEMARIGRPVLLRGPFHQQRGRRHRAVPGHHGRIGIQRRGY